MEKQELIILVKKFLAGKCTPEEKHTLEHWWASAMDDDRFLKELPENDREALKLEMLGNIRQMIRAREMRVEKGLDEKGNVKHLTPAHYSYWKLAAAAVSLLLVASILLILMVHEPREIYLKTAYGERLNVELPDHSTVVLNGNSSLRYSRWESNEDRKVWLEGEAFFSVKHTENDNRFVVYTPDSVTIEVLGTQFSVNNRKGNTDVVLREGEVKLAKKEATYVMKPDEMVSYSKTESRFVTHTVDAGQMVAWKDNLLIYEDETVGAIVEKLNESHGIKVTFRSESIKKEIFNGSVPADSVSLFFDKINKLYGAKVARMEDGSYVIE
jgi:ferric-dicitrate binding protein FerR (iron transport regulator)